MFLPAQTIRELALRGMITPFSERAEFNGVSYGLSPAGYDLRVDGDLDLWPGRSVRVDAMEELCLPDDIIGFLFTKSTWARLHVEQAGTVVDPGFRGKLRLEINQHSGNPVFISAGTGVVHMVFGQLTEFTEMPYRGKYQNQRANQDAIIKGQCYP